jgi:hypothetical protein
MPRVRAALKKDAAPRGFPLIRQAGRPIRAMTVKLNNVPASGAASARQ